MNMKMRNIDNDVTRAIMTAHGVVKSRFVNIAYRVRAVTRTKFIRGIWYRVS